MIPSSRPTLFEDWTARRIQLYRQNNPPSAYLDVQIQVLDYLLKRYHDAPEAERPARFPLPKDLQWNQRAQIVHRHLAQQKATVIRDESDARSRIGPLLARMAALNVQADLGPPAKGSLGFGEALKDASEVLERGFTKELPASLSFRLFRDAETNVDRWLTAFSEMLPDRQLEVLRGHFQRARYYPEDDREDATGRGGFSRRKVPPSVSLAFLQRCQHPDALGFMVLLWKGALIEGPNAALKQNLEAHFDSVREPAAEYIRFELANIDPRIRLHSIRMLGKLGTLHDIGMLSDLLSLPQQEDEAPGERDSLLDALRAISKRNP